MTTATLPAVARDRKWVVLAIIGVAQLMVVLDATIVNIALPAAQHDLGFTDHDRQWVITAYSLAFGSLLLLGGRLSDIFGRKNTFIVGLAGFALASALGGAADSFAWLVGARALQGAFGALLAPSALGLMTTTFTDPKERGRAFGIFGAIAGSGGAVGLLLGGALTQYATWRWCLFVNLIFAVFALAGAALYLRKSPPATAKPHVNIPSVVSVSAGLGALVYGFSNAGITGWGSPVTIGFLAAGAVLVAAFVILQSRVRYPLLPLRVILDRDRGASYLVIGLIAIGMFGIFLFLTYYMELDLGFTPFLTGVAFLPLTLSIIIGSTFVGGRLLPRVGPKPLVFAGGLAAAIGMLLLARIDIHSNYLVVVLPALVIMGVGLGTAFSAAIATSTSGVQPDDAGVASATVNTAQQVGGSIGTALLSTLSANAVLTFVSAHGASGGTHGVAIVFGYQVVFWTSAVVFACAAVCGGILLRARPKLPGARPRFEVAPAPMVAAHCAIILTHVRN